MLVYLLARLGLHKKSYRQIWLKFLREFRLSPTKRW